MSHHSFHNYSSDEEDDYDYNDYDDDTYDVLVFFPLLAAIIVGLFLHIMAVVHALLWEMYSAFAASIVSTLLKKFLCIGCTFITYVKQVP